MLIMDNIQYRHLPVKLREFQKIIKHLQNTLNVELDNNIFIMATNIRDYIISLDTNNELSIYAITNLCIEYINDLYMNKQSEP